MTITPNPVYGTAFVSIHLKERSIVALEVFSMIGARVATLLTAQELSSGMYAIPLHTERFASSMYLLLVV
jgi:hypothetical protein